MRDACAEEFLQQHGNVARAHHGRLKRGQTRRNLGRVRGSPIELGTLPRVATNASNVDRTGAGAADGSMSESLASSLMMHSAWGSRAQSP